MLRVAPRSGQGPELTIAVTAALQLSNVGPSIFLSNVSDPGPGFRVKKPGVHLVGGALYAIVCRMTLQRCCSARLTA